VRAFPTGLHECAIGIAKRATEGWPDHPQWRREVAPRPPGASVRKATSDVATWADLWPHSCQKDVANRPGSDLSRTADRGFVRQALVGDAQHQDCDVVMGGLLLEVHNGVLYTGGNGRSVESN
jgi:hypothetical protein